MSKKRKREKERKKKIIHSSKERWEDLFARLGWDGVEWSEVEEAGDGAMLEKNKDKKLFKGYVRKEKKNTHQEFGLL